MSVNCINKETVNMSDKNSLCKKFTIHNSQFTIHNYLKTAFLCIFTLVITNCKTESVSEVLKTLRSEKYVQHLEAGHHKLSFRYVPETLSLLATASLDTNRECTKELLDSLRKANPYRTGLSFSMVLSPNVGSDNPGNFTNDVVYGQLSGTGDYRETLNRYLFKLKANLWLEINGKKYEMLNYQMVRSWGMTKSRTFMLLFDDIMAKEPDAKELALVAENIVPGQGRDKFTWDLPLSEYDYVN
jgi:hypothetical protein